MLVPASFFQVTLAVVLSTVAVQAALFPPANPAAAVSPDPPSPAIHTRRADAESFIYATILTDAAYETVRLCLESLSDKDPLAAVPVLELLEVLGAEGLREVDQTVPQEPWYI